MSARREWAQQNTTDLMTTARCAIGGGTVVIALISCSCEERPPWEIITVAHDTVRSEVGHGDGGLARGTHKRIDSQITCDETRIIGEESVCA
jgi:hypothetical protein